MKSILTDLAKQQIRQTAKYIRKEFGKKRRDEFMQEVRQTRVLIENSPNIGSVEPLLGELPEMYRGYVMNHLNKIIYCVRDEVIVIVDLWDVRRDPSKLAEEVEGEPSHTGTGTV